MVCMTASVTVVKRQKIIHFLLVYRVFADSPLQYRSKPNKVPCNDMYIVRKKHHLILCTWHGSNM